MTTPHDVRRRLCNRRYPRRTESRAAMTVYVDDMYTVRMGGFGRMKMSHMIADSEEELHAMADKIGVARKWYQGDHYDIAMSKRALAVKFGAVEITMRELAQKARDARHAQAAELKAASDA